ncbi:MAG: hypothetical protein U1F47_05390 [Hyphomicrobiales bacterium]|jgi:hypothetical protein
MSKTQTESQEPRQKQRKLSPELREFLHMLQALEGQLDASPRLPR